ncbi:acyl-ACP thioesterase [Thermoclostridium stercorarium subsp. stercorarium DSM 8532]|uniref:Acyl-ACP thioesterase n=2 Tax=Thermoclostridium stercorarium TaxID=1510 RepID=L7VMU3_THES1|nr:acyl-ACP thioesterase domain-containing protein [Thermoclostridium stercorarium]AGC67979.1 acyl-ACP thioesterase [Thermoclostridium stercorarium subsp. stercorarium DSM 8532]AGI39014.1 acyl-ACP thioesterase [Thermoclostridium stercorarium subsp. stercorarium DSM 8532]ANW98381.1 acyl-ACP thioesterase [Thermoclostridium stercorarium subsp. thermolacticum DSM 2910]UZQ86522.1 thioesterase [Thermoclostridium stercorarium]
MIPELVYRNSYIVGYRDVDFNNDLRLSSLFGYFQDTAIMNVEKLGIGVNTLSEKYSVSWVLTKILVEINRIPKWNEKITVETWPHRPKKFEFDRDFRVRDDNGNIIAAAISNWVLLDLKTREIRKSEIISGDYPPLEFTDERALEGRLRKLRPAGEPEVVYKRVLGYSDTDANGHINNAKYIDFIMDCFSIEEHKKHSVRSIQVNYLKEVFPGDTLILYRDVSGAGSNQVYIEGINEADQKPAFSAELKFD